LIKPKELDLTRTIRIDWISEIENQDSSPTFDFNFVGIAKGIWNDSFSTNRENDQYL
jgi:hypothetical protein